MPLLHAKTILGYTCQRVTASAGFEMASIVESPWFKRSEVQKVPRNWARLCNLGLKKPRIEEIKVPGHLGIVTQYFSLFI
jgi:hypothetical protein